MVAGEYDLRTPWIPAIHLGSKSRSCVDRRLDLCPPRSPLTPLSNFEYQWADEVIKTPIAVSAPEYMDYLFLWIQAQLTNPTFFPTKPGPLHSPLILSPLPQSNPFPRTLSLVWSTCFADYFVFGLICGGLTSISSPLLTGKR